MVTLGIPGILIPKNEEVMEYNILYHNNSVEVVRAAEDTTRAETEMGNGAGTSGPNIRDS